MSDDVTVLENRARVYDDGTLAKVRVLAVPASEKFPKGIKYSYHYTVIGAENPIIRLDNHHGPHELHLGETTFEIDFPGRAPLYRAWRAALPAEKRADW